MTRTLLVPGEVNVKFPHAHGHKSQHLSPCHITPSAICCPTAERTERAVFAEFFVVEKALGVKGGGVVAKDGGVKVQLTVGDEDFGAGAQCDGAHIGRLRDRADGSWCGGVTQHLVVEGDRPRAVLYAVLEAREAVGKFWEQLVSNGLEKGRVVDEISHDPKAELVCVTVDTMGKRSAHVCLKGFGYLKCPGMQRKLDNRKVLTPRKASRTKPQYPSLRLQSSAFRFPVFARPSSALSFRLSEGRSTSQT